MPKGRFLFDDRRFELKTEKVVLERNKSYICRFKIDSPGVMPVYQYVKVTLIQTNQKGAEVFWIEGKNLHTRTVPRPWLIVPAELWLKRPLLYRNGYVVGCCHQDDVTLATESAFFYPRLRPTPQDVTP